MSKALGCNVLTGDGYLMAAEAGAEFSGMEFSNAYGIAPAFASVTKTAYYQYASFYYEDGTLVEGAGSKQGRAVIARNLLEGRQVYARLDHVSYTQLEVGIRDSVTQAAPEAAPALPRGGRHTPPRDAPHAPARQMPER